MNNRKLLFVAILGLAFAQPAFADPFVITDPLPAGVVQCGVFLDSAAKITIPVTPITLPIPGNICAFDIVSVPPGSHTISMTSITVNDPVFGSKESAKSVPLVFPVPGIPPTPTGERLVSKIPQ